MAPILNNENGIKIYVQGREHLPPHIHVETRNDVALIDIRSGKLITGTPPGKALQFVQQWLDENENRSQAEEIYFKYNPGSRFGKNNEDESNKK